MQGRKRSKHLAGTKLCYRRRGASKAYTKRRSSLEASIFQYEFKFTVTWNVLTKLQQVIAKMKSKHMAGTFTKKKKCIVTGVCSDVQAWPGREKEDLIEKRAYFGIKTAERIIEFECESKRDKQF
ncbi:VAN3-binding protein [Arachis hypogaea]|nr:VAN3-binding protein [Arachis hypogaea]